MVIRTIDMRLDLLKSLIRKSGIKAKVAKIQTMDLKKRRQQERSAHLFTKGLESPYSASPFAFHSRSKISILIRNPTNNQVQPREIRRINIVDVRRRIPIPGWSSPIRLSTGESLSDI